MKPLVIALVQLVFVVFIAPVYSAQSTITEAAGSACMGDDRSRKQTEEAALTEAKKRAVEQVGIYLQSESAVKNFVLEKDLLAAYARAEVKIIQELAREWYKDPDAGDCFRLRIKAEVLPDTAALQKMAAQGQASADDPSAPLLVKVWTDKKTYATGDRIKIYLKGNKPFHARILYKDASGEYVQILPNPHRRESYFSGGTMYEVPSGNDRFVLEVSPPFGEENITVYASSAPLGELSTETRGGVYLVTTKAKEVGARTRGIKIAENQEGTAGAAEFFEDTVKVKTGK